MELDESLTALCDVWHHLEMILAPCARSFALRFAVKELSSEPVGRWTGLA